MEKTLHTDNCYRDRFQQYYLYNGDVADSRQKNWRHVEWEKVIAVKTVVKDKTYLTHCKHPDFKFFIVYRWGGHEWKGSEKVAIKQWAVGWSNGERCFMTDIDFKTGEIVRQYVVPVDQVKSHIHPRVIWQTSN